MDARRTAKSIFGIILLLITNFFSAQSSAAPANRTAGAIITGAWSDPDKCNLTSAIRMQFREVLGNASALSGKCIAVEGYWAGRALFGRARDGNQPRSNVDEALGRKRIGLYAREEIFEAAPERSTRYVVVGIVGECASEWPDAMMVLGYCHYADGLILKVSEVVRVE